jgi:succinate dehydrogenase / fumarate reductase cytochrome b subunit
MDRVERPLSPHLSVYRWQVTNSLSILHRLTGLFLAVGIAFLVWWLVALASGPDAYAGAQRVFANPWFKLPLAAWIACFFYHLANGVRHLVWDAGFGFDRAQIRAGGWAAVLVAVAAAAVYAFLAFT